MIRRLYLFRTVENGTFWFQLWPLMRCGDEVKIGCFGFVVLCTIDQNNLSFSNYFCLLTWKTCQTLKALDDLLGMGWWSSPLGHLDSPLCRCHRSLSLLLFCWCPLHHRLLGLAFQVWNHGQLGGNFHRNENLQTQKQFSFNKVETDSKKIILVFIGQCGINRLLFL